jgi:hypothetical protein
MNQSIADYFRPHCRRAMRACTAPNDRRVLHGMWLHYGWCWEGVCRYYSRINNTHYWRVEQRLRDRYACRNVRQLSFDF